MTFFTPWRMSRLIAWLFATFFVLIYHFVPNEMYAGAERAAYDRWAKWQLTDLRETRLVLVDIDEKSLASVGPWPWPRQTIASLISQLTNHYEVSALGLDIIFVDPRDGDQNLSQVLNDSRVVMSQTFDMAARSENRSGFLADTFSLHNYPGSLAAQAGGYIANHQGLLQPQSKVGHISPLIDPDGKVRRLYPVICWQGDCSLALSFRIWQSLMGESQLRWQQQDGKQAWALSSHADATIPVDREGAVKVPYRIPSGGFEYISASDVLNKKIAPERLNRLIVLVGSTALGLGDRVATPIDAIAPGIEVHAQLLSAMLDGALFQVRSVSWWQALLVYGFLGLSIWMWPVRGSKAVISWICCATLIVVGGLIYFLKIKAWMIPMTPWFVWLGVIGFTWFGFESLRLSRQLQQVATQFSHFLPASLVRRVLREPQVHAESERQTLTVLVADMRGFTQACEGKSPESAALLAQQCLSVLSTEVSRYQGTVEKYTGDGLMAIWGAPLSDAGHAQHALEAALAMRDAVEDLQTWLVEHDFPAMRVSIGINTGEMAVGLFGGQSHLAWTAQGDAVNLANRIEQLTRTVGCDLLMGEMTAQLIGIDRCDFMGSHIVKGRLEPVPIYTLKR